MALLDPFQLWVLSVLHKSADPFNPLWRCDGRIMKTPFRGKERGGLCLE